LIHIEKNYFARSILGLSAEESHRRFEIDFFVDGGINIFDGNKLSPLIDAIQKKINIFESFGTKGSRKIFNLLFSSQDVEGVYFAGWFLKIKFQADPLIKEYLALYSRGSAVETIGTTPKDIAAKSQLVKNVKNFY
jgi:hypothetical protein